MCRKDKGLAFLLGLLNLAGVARLELATIGFGDRCSTNWNYTPVDEMHYAKTTDKGKALFASNTTDCGFFSQISKIEYALALPYTNLFLIYVNTS